MTYADIASGETNIADIAFLVAVIVAVIAAFFFLSPTRQLGQALVAIAVGLIAFGFLML